MHEHDVDVAQWPELPSQLAQGAPERATQVIGNVGLEQIDHRLQPAGGYARMMNRIRITADDDFRKQIAQVVHPVLEKLFEIACQGIDRTILSLVVPCSCEDCIWESLI